MIPKILISRPKVIVDYKCPKCRHIDIVALPEVTTTCKNCKTKVTTEVQVNITYAVWKNLMQLLAYNNEVHLVGEIYASNLVDVSDTLARYGRHDDDIYSAMLSMYNTLRKHQNWEVEDICIAEDIQNETTCRDCGFCTNCKKCKSCGSHYVPKQVSTKDGKQLRYTCPDCGSKEYENTKIDKFINKDNKRLCPHCKSDKNTAYTFNSNQNNCPKCNSTNINLPKKIKVYLMKVKRQKRNEIPEGENYA